MHSAACICLDRGIGRGVTPRAGPGVCDDDLPFDYLRVRTEFYRLRFSTTRIAHTTDIGVGGSQECPTFDVVGMVCESLLQAIEHGRDRRQIL